ncbi:hypothetical protein J6590_054042 [Homalodisca vitripennis]|nr:hypothetical protein J6590_054042 [Homalodisca vitripennis]
MFTPNKTNYETNVDEESRGPHSDGSAGNRMYRMCLMTSTHLTRRRIASLAAKFHISLACTECPKCQTNPLQCRRGWYRHSSGLMTRRDVSKGCTGRQQVA